MNQELYLKKSEPVYKTDNLVIYPPDSNGVMLADWTGFLTASIAKTGCLAMLEYLEKHPADKIINNNTKVTGHHAGAIDWVGNVWFTGMYDRGVRHFAWVYSKEFYTQIGTDEVVTFNTKIKLQTFYSFNEAYRWLLGD